MAASPKFSRINGFIDRIGAVEVPFSIEMPDGHKRDVGEGEPKFHVALRTDRAVKALGSLDEANIGEAYLQGDIDLEGDMISPFALRASLDDSHPIVAAWRFIQPLIFGQVFTNKAAIELIHHNMAQMNGQIHMIKEVTDKLVKGTFGTSPAEMTSQKYPCHCDHLDQLEERIIAM